MKKRTEEQKNVRLLKEENGKFYIKWPNLQVPLVLNKYFFDKLVEEQRINIPKELATMS